MWAARSVAELYSVETQNLASLRTDVEWQMQAELQPILTRIGLELVQLRFVDFFCPTYDPIRQQEAQLYVDTRGADVEIDRIKLTQRLRKTLTAEKMDQLKTDRDFEDFVRQTEHEMGSGTRCAAMRWRRLKREFVFQRDKTVLLQEIEIAGIRDTDERNRTRSSLIARIENENREHEARLPAASPRPRMKPRLARSSWSWSALESEQDFWEAEKAIELRRKSQMAQVDVEERQQQLNLQRQQEQQKIEAERLRELEVVCRSVAEHSRRPAGGSDPQAGAIPGEGEVDAGPAHRAGRRGQPAYGSSPGGEVQSRGGAERRALPAASGVPGQTGGRRARIRRPPRARVERCAGPDGPDRDDAPRRPSPARPW